jgi:hypothetical protein
MTDVQNSQSAITSDLIAGLTASIPSIPDPLATLAADRILPDLSAVWAAVRIPPDRLAVWDGATNPGCCDRSSALSLPEIKPGNHTWKVALSYLQWNRANYFEDILNNVILTYGCWYGKSQLIYWSWNHPKLPGIS